jgi:hypothetical protein
MNTAESVRQGLPHVLPVRVREQPCRDRPSGGILKSLALTVRAVGRSVQGTVTIGVRIASKRLTPARRLSPGACSRRTYGRAVEAG